MRNLIDLLLGPSAPEDSDKRKEEPFPPRLEPPPQTKGLAPAPQLHDLRPINAPEDLQMFLPEQSASLRPVPAALVASLLGPEAAVYPMTEITFQQALRLRTEQEKTRQEQIRLEVSTKNLAIMELASRSEIPPHLIPYMVAGDPSDPRPMISPQQPIPPQQMMAPHGYPPFFQPQMSPQGGVRQSPVGRHYENADNASIVAPLNYRFGLGPKLNPETPQRTLSPAKIGAAAVANLTNPVTPYRQTYRTIPSHQRHFSMPADPGIMGTRSSERIKSKSLHPSRLRSPQGSTSAIQVKPSPAQPLHKQTKNSQIPSQESMTSFQHIIQFHHWKPQNPDEQPPSDKPPGPISDIPLGQYSMEPVSISRSSSRAGVSHKRHKSSDMSVDLLSQGNPYFPAPVYGSGGPPGGSQSGHSYPVTETNEEDVSMELSDSSANDLKPGTSSANKDTKKRAGRPRRHN